MTTEDHQRATTSLALKVGEGGPYAKECGWPHEAGKDKGIDSFGACRKEPSPALEGNTFLLF